jgi:trehalose 6-phosphate phosphatase
MLAPAPRLVLGKAVVNAIPSGNLHKGSAMLELMHQLKTSGALYVGDDDTDEDVFSLPDERIVTVRIGKKAASAAQWYLARQSQIGLLLQYLTPDPRPSGVGLAPDTHRPGAGTGGAC